jgi:ParB/RepB/Spo0J family partition protein
MKKKSSVATPVGANGEVAAVWVDIAALVPWDKNPRRNIDAVKKVAASIRKFGFANPILARRQDGQVIAGHTRLAAAQKLGLKTVPVRYMDMDATDAHLLALADNKLGEIAEWDDAALTEIFSQLQIEDADLASTGFSDAEVERLLNDVGEEEKPDTSPQLDGLTYQILIECSSEDQQAEQMGIIEGLGITCKPLIL